MLACEQQPRAHGGGSGGGARGKAHTRLLPPRGACGAVELRCFPDEKARLPRLSPWPEPEPIPNPDP